MEGYIPGRYVIPYSIACDTKLFQTILYYSM